MRAFILIGAFLATTLTVGAASAHGPQRGYYRPAPRPVFHGGSFGHFGHATFGGHASRPSFGHAVRPFGHGVRR